jgi:predicted CoA-binding protein
MAIRERIEDFLAQKRIAIAGVSSRPDDFSRKLFGEFRKRGYDVVAVNPSVGEVDGQRCFARVQEIEPPVDGVLLMTSPAATHQVVRDCAEAGVPRVWMYRAAGAGAVNAEAVQFCLENGISVVPGQCPYMFLPKSGWVHRVHGLVNRLTGSYPV